MASPITLVSKARTEAREILVIREVLSLDRIRIEVVIHMNGIHIIAREDVLHHFTDVFPTLGEGWIKEQLITISNEPFRMGIVEVTWSQFVLQRCLDTVRIYPGMKLHATFVALVYHELHGIPIRFGCLSLYTREKAAPRFELGDIEGIGFGAYLEDDGIDACRMK